MKFHNHKIENFGSPYVISELGSNHNGDMNMAKKLIDASKEAGAHCVKFQSWSKDSIFSRSVYDQNFFLKDDYRDRSDYTLEQIVDEFSISENELIDMKDYCNKIGIGFSSTPFSRKEADFLVNELGAEFIKVASMDCNNYPFLDYLARKGKPIIISTGFSTLAEIDRAVRTIEEAGNTDIAILHCVANYPPKDENVNLNNIDYFRNVFPKYPIGFSDHSIGTSIPLASIAKGACILEKHFTLDKEMFGWDHKVSANPEEMKEICEQGARIQVALGSFSRIVTDDDQERMPSFRRSIVAAKEIPVGKVIEESDLEYKRPGTGIAPGSYELLIGRTAKKDISFDQLISWDDV